MRIPCFVVLVLATASACSKPSEPEPAATPAPQPATQAPALTQQAMDKPAATGSTSAANAAQEGKGA